MSKTAKGLLWTSGGGLTLLCGQAGKTKEAKFCSTGPLAVENGLTFSHWECPIQGSNLRF